MENSERTASVVCDFEDGKAKNRVQFVNSVIKEEDWASLGVGDIIVDSAADESCWPVGQGDAFPTKESRRKMLLRTANGGDMQHCGEKEVTFKYDGGESKDRIGLKFQVTDVRKPLLAVRRLVEKGNKVVLAGDDEESFIMNKATKVKIPVRKKGGAFVIEAHFVGVSARGAGSCDQAVRPRNVRGVGDGDKEQKPEERVWRTRGRNY